MSHPEAFVPNVAGAWIHPDAALAAKVIRSGMNCPSGAIRVLAQDGSTSDAPPVVNTLRLREIGPLALEAPILLRGEMRDTPPAAAAQWAVAVAGGHRGGDGDRPNRQPRDRSGAVPVRAIAEQALLRWQSQSGRVSGGLSAGRHPIRAASKGYFVRFSYPVSVIST